MSIPAITVPDKLQEVLGRDGSRDLVEVVGQVAATKVDKTDFQEFCARIDYRFDAIDAKFAAIDARFDVMDAKFEARFDAMDAKFNYKFDAMDAKFNGKFDAMDAKFNGKSDAMDSKFDTMDAKLEGKFNTMDVKIEKLRIDLESNMNKALLKSLAWVIGAMLTVAGLQTAALSFLLGGK